MRTPEEIYAAIFPQIQYHFRHSSVLSDLEDATRDVVNALEGVLEATKPRQITTQEELDALPICTAIRDGDPEVCVKVEPTGWLAEIDGEVYRSDQITLPATVLWEPTA